MVLHRNQRKDVEKAKRIGIEAYREEQQEKKKILDKLLEKYDGGQQNVFFCLAVNILELADLKETMEQIESAVRGMEPSKKTEFVVQQLHACAEKRNLFLELHVTDDPWFE